jgi:3-oxoacyl-[acyl-carrier protein] reductase
MKLKDKVAIITGAGRGLGRASAIEMAKEDASVAIISRTLSELTETANKIKAFGGNVLSIKADVSKGKDILKIVDKTISAFGKINILMNNAAIIGPIAPMFKVEDETWKATLDIILKGPFMLSKATISHMIKDGGGKIINVTSGLGVMAMPLFGAYSISKAGLIHLTRIMAEELSDYNIQVNGLDPGVMDTRMQEEVRAMGPEILGKDIYDEFLSMKLRGQLKPPEKVAKLALFLASDESNNIMGENGTESYYKRFGYHG